MVDRNMQMSVGGLRLQADKVKHWTSSSRSSRSQNASVLGGVSKTARRDREGNDIPKRKRTKERTKENEERRERERKADAMAMKWPGAFEGSNLICTRSLPSDSHITLHLDQQAISVLILSSRRHVLSHPPLVACSTLSLAIRYV